MAKFGVMAIFLALTLSFGSGSPQAPGELIPSIVGGLEARPGEFPWIVEIKRTSHHCGATIVNENWIVTAAHCTQDAASTYTVVAGEHDLNVKEGTEQSRSIVKIVNHPKYKSGGSSENDISLMKVSKPFTLNSRVQKVKLAASGFKPTPMVIAAGWGGTTEGGSGSTKLLKVDVPYIPDAQCGKAYPGKIKETMMCAGVSGKGGKDACQGDSGGPLMCKSGAGSVLCGVVSWGTGCARGNYPGVYTEVSYYTSWINSVVKS